MRLIDGDRLKKEIHENDIMGGLNYAWYIDHAELVDAVEVRHGYLVNAHPYGECSECGYLIDSRDGYNYCPNCGAKMDGKVKDDA